MMRLLQRLIRWLGSDRRSNTPGERCRANGIRGDWSLGDRAGPMRNAEMLKQGRPDLVLAFYDGPRRTGGTADMVRRAHAAGVPVEEFHV